MYGWRTFPWIGGAGRLQAINRPNCGTPHVGPDARLVIKPLSGVTWTEKDVIVDGMDWREGVHGAPFNIQSRPRAPSDDYVLFTGVRDAEGESHEGVCAELVVISVADASVNRL